MTAGGFNGAAAKRPRKDGRSSLIHSGRAASMGPRPNGRGKIQAGQIIQGATPRFNGAAAKRPRKDAFADLLAREDLASMGPRPNGRGKFFPGASFFSTASSFNGAAAKRPRKVEIFGLAARLEASFNGAAAKRPRKGCMRPADPPRRQLQWGRGQTAAESPAALYGTMHYALLQWGRGQTAAERSNPDSLPVPHPNSFNGAAAKRPRKARCAGRPARQTRGFNGAAAKRPRKDNDGAEGDNLLPASMGPRPNGRGKSVYVERAPPFQSGFNGAAAKRPRKATSRPHRPAAPHSFNGAAAKRPRKG